MSQHRSPAGRPVRLVGAMLLLLVPLTSCSKNPIDRPPLTIEVASAAVSPATQTPPAGLVLPWDGTPRGALFDAASASLVVLTPAEGPTPAGVAVLGRSGAVRTVPLSSPAEALAGDGRGTAYAATRGGFFSVDLAAATATKTEIAGQGGTDFTAIARRADGRLVLGTADGAVLTLAPDLSVSRRIAGFARVDAIVTVGDAAVVLDRGQTSVTALDPAGERTQALRAGLGATSITADPADRVLVVDTRGGQLLVFGVDPLIERQAYPVGDSPYGVVGSSTWVWVSQTSTNTVVGYDLATGIPVEKVRYPTVRQPNSLAYDDSSGTLYVVSGAGAGVQMIPGAGGDR